MGTYGFKKILIEVIIINYRIERIKLFLLLNCFSTLIILSLSLTTSACLSLSVPFCLSISLPLCLFLSVSLSLSLSHSLILYFYFSMSFYYCFSTSGNLKRSQAATAANEVSSRSHAVLQVQHHVIKF